MVTPMKLQMPIARKMLWGTFLVALFLSGNGTFAATSERELLLTTYLRDGPGLRYRAVDEAQTGTLVSVIGCVGGWCNVLYGGVTGYVAQSALTVAAGEPTPVKNPPCIVGAEASYHGSRAVRYCRASTPSNERPPAATP